jgi:hypothetical protein
MFSDFRFLDHERLSLWWRSPNAAGAFIVSLLPIVWLMNQWLSSGRWRRLSRSTWLLEVVLYYAVAQTYSRGALLSAVVLLGSMTRVMFRQSADSTFAYAILPVISRWTLLMSATLFSQFSERIAPSYLATDGSVLGRMAVWRGACVLSIGSPWSGWGQGLSGFHYANLIQGIADARYYGGMLNVVLDIVVDYGFPCAFCVLMLLLWLIMVGTSAAWTTCCGDNRLDYTCGGVLIVWFATNLTSSLWHESTLLALPGVAGTWLIFRAARKPLMRHWNFVICSAFVAAGTLGGVAAIGKYEAGHSDIVVKKVVGGAKLTARGREDGGTMWLLPDQEVLGKNPGKAARDFLVHSARYSNVVMLYDDPKAVETASTGNDVILVCGLRYSGNRELRNAHGLTIFLLPRFDGDVPLFSKEDVRYLLAQTRGLRRMEINRAELDPLVCKRLISIPLSGRCVLGLWPAWFLENRLF